MVSRMSTAQITKQCVTCNTTFHVPNYRKETAKFCSKTCHDVVVLRVKYTCQGCKNEFEVSASRSNQKFCSRECRSSIAMSTSERRKRQKALQNLSRGSNSSRNLRNNVFKVVEPVCAVCDYNDKMYCIELHHIDNNPNNNNFDNIAVLCVICHRKLHKGDLDYAAKERLVRKNYKFQHTGND